MTETNLIRWERDTDGVVTLTMDNPSQSANTMTPRFWKELQDHLERIDVEREGITGVIITSAKKTFLAGGDLNELRNVPRGSEQARLIAEDSRRLRLALRRLETSGLPVVAAINGAAMGGGLELALIAHHRVMLDAAGVKVGLPEVQLGLLPGGGGTVRTVRMLGIATALMEILLPGKPLRPDKALKLKLVDELVSSPQELLPAAKRWITENPEASQPWDRPGYSIPGGTTADNVELRMNAIALPSTLRKQLKGADYPAPRAIMACVVEGSLVDIDTALEVEGRYLIKLLTGQTAKNMIQAFFFDMRRVSGARERPDDWDRWTPEKVAVLGAGMMGAAIAYVTAKAGTEVVLKDISPEAAAKGKGYSAGLVEKAVARGRMSQANGQALLDRITPTAEASDAEGADCVVEAVFEKAELKQQVFNEIQPYLADGALMCSNTSTLPISELAEAVERPADFIGTHFFSPVDKMPLLEIVRGQDSSDEALFRALDFARHIGKTPIVVNDSRGFYTSRVIKAWVDEGLGMVSEGIPPASIEQATTQAGFPMPLLSMADEMNLNLHRSIKATYREAAEAEGVPYEVVPADGVVARMIDEFDRPGRVAGRGFYEYEAAGGKRLGIWDGYRDAFGGENREVPLQDLIDRLLFCESLEAVRCYEEGVVTSVADANIGSIMGIGFPARTGGALQFINGYEGGVAGFVTRATELAEKYGQRFEPPALLVERAERAEPFSDERPLAAAV